MNCDQHPLAEQAAMLLNEARAFREEHNPPHQAIKWGGDLTLRAQYDAMLTTAIKLFDVSLGNYAPVGSTASIKGTGE